LATLVSSTTASAADDVEQDAAKFLEDYDATVATLMNAMTIAQWNYETNITDENAEAALNASMGVSEEY
jgi:hypothetical protein